MIVNKLFTHKQQGNKLLTPLVFIDPTDDGPEVEILREGKSIVRQGDTFVLAHPLPRQKNRWS